MTNITEPQNKNLNNPILFDTCFIVDLIDKNENKFDLSHLYLELLISKGYDPIILSPIFFETQNKLKNREINYRPFLDRNLFEYSIEFINEQDLAKAAEIVIKLEDQSLSLADAVLAWYSYDNDLQLISYDKDFGIIAQYLADKYGKNKILYWKEIQNEVYKKS
jgi:predicted nucleic acid-binding protein